MKKIIHKLFWAWEFDKEEKWLNEMAAKGLRLTSVSFCKYEFEECLPGEYSIRLELLENNIKHADSKQYIEFVEETGATYIGSVINWVYFSKKATNGAFDLYSDKQSRIKYLNRILILLGWIIVLNLYIGVYNLFIYFFLNSYLNIIGLINLSIVLLTTIGFFKVYQKKRKLKKEQQIFE